MTQQPVLLGEEEETMGTQGGPLAGACERDKPQVWEGESKISLAKPWQAPNSGGENSNLKNEAKINFSYCSRKLYFLVSIQGLAREVLNLSFQYGQ